MNFDTTPTRHGNAKDKVVKAAGHVSDEAVPAVS